MAKQFILQPNEDSWLATVASLYDLYEEAKYPLKLTVTNYGKRSLDQNALQHCIYQEVSAYLIRNKRKECNPAWVKKMLKNKYLGWTQEAFTDVLTGEVVQRDVLRSTSALDVGEAYQYTTQILDWADSIGCEIKIPANCQYRQIMEQQNQ